MGVKYLWGVLRRFSSKRRLSDLAKKRLAIDLSIWIVALSNKKGSHCLRNIFHRTKRLLLLGIHPVFVLEGQAPYFKAATIEKRRKLFRKSQRNKGRSSETGGYQNLKAILQKCKQIFEALGLSCVQSPGEAEKCCAQLEKSKLVDGCLTEDCDIFLYGGETVYRNFNSKDSSVDEYQISTITETLSLQRRDLIAIALLCGCDFYEGVPDVGITSAMNFLNSIDDEDGLTRLVRWRNDPHFKDLEKVKSLVQKRLLCNICGHNGRRVVHIRSGCKMCGSENGCTQSSSQQLLSDLNIELEIRRKALSDPTFPPEEIIAEYCEDLSSFSCDTTWKKPDIFSFIKISAEYLGWSRKYAVRSFLPIITRWQIIQLQGFKDSCFQEDFLFIPHQIIKKRALRGVSYFEIEWTSQANILDAIDDNEKSVVTVEPQDLIEKAYPDLVEAFVPSKNHPKRDCESKRKNTLLRSSTKIRKKTAVKNPLHIKRKLPWLLRSQNNEDHISQAASSSDPCQDAG